MKKNNPFAITFGLKPDNYISRLSQSDEIITTFENSSVNNVYMITGVRGVGKTVMLSNIAEHFSTKEDWLVVELIPNMDMLDQLASKLYDLSLFNKIFNGKTFGFSFNGISFSIKGEKPLTNIVSLIEILFEKVEKKNKKVLICIDEALKNEHLKIFVQTFQLLLRKKMPIYLLMTGLYNNIYELSNDNSLTFLYRAPKINLGPLSIMAIKNSYEGLLNVDDKYAKDLASLTKGYAFAYQLLGYLVYENDYKSIKKDLLSKFDQYLEENIFYKIWSELSEKDKVVLFSFDHDIAKVETIMDKASMPKNIFSTYRDRLIKKGIVISSGRGMLEIALPRFYEYVQFKK